MPAPIISAEKLREIAALPSAGAAESELRRLGYWDEFASEPGDLKTYHVRLSGLVVSRGHVRVTARSEKEAEHKAFDLVADGNVEWDVECSDPGDFDIEGVEVVK